MKSRLFSRTVIGMTAVLLGFAASVKAGPPLICHPIDIGQAKSAAFGGLEPERGRGI